MYNPFIQNFSFRNRYYGIPSYRIPQQVQPNHLPTNSKTFDEPTKETFTHSRSQEESVFLELFGIKLFFDDILILCLLFFLYTEGVKDEMLFISLILLLLS